jgi:hypothetical protein
MLQVVAFLVGVVGTWLGGDARANDGPAVTATPLFAAAGGQPIQRRMFSAAVGGFTVNLVAPDASRDTGAGHLTGAPATMALIGSFSLDGFRILVDMRREQLATDGQRTSTEVGFGYQARPLTGLAVGVSPTIGFGDVTPARGATPTDAGWRSVGVSGTATYDLSENWALTGVLGYRYRAESANGRTRDDGSFFSIFGLGYRF